MRRAPRYRMVYQNLLRSLTITLLGFDCGMKELVVSHINAHVGRTGTAGRKEHQVSNLQLIPVDFFSLLILLPGRAGQINIELGEQALDQSGTIETGFFGTSAAPVANPDHFESGFHETQARGWRFRIRLSDSGFSAARYTGRRFARSAPIWLLSWRVLCLLSATWEPGNYELLSDLDFRTFQPVGGSERLRCGLVFPGDLEEAVSLPDHIGLAGCQRGFGLRVGLDLLCF